MQRPHRHGKRHELQNQQVRFYLRDVYVPEPAQILAELHGGDVLRGRVIDLSDAGSKRNAFAVVEVDGFVHPLVVPVAKILDVEK